MLGSIDALLVSSGVLMVNVFTPNILFEMDLVSLVKSRFEKVYELNLGNQHFIHRATSPVKPSAFDHKGSISCTTAGPTKSTWGGSSVLEFGGLIKGKFSAAAHKVASVLHLGPRVGQAETVSAPAPSPVSATPTSTNEGLTL